TNALAALVAHQVRRAAPCVRDLAGGRDLEPLLHTLVGFQLGHSTTVSVPDGIGSNRIAGLAGRPAGGTGRAPPVSARVGRIRPEIANAPARSRRDGARGGGRSAAPARSLGSDPNERPSSRRAVGSTVKHRGGRRAGKSRMVTKRPARR